MNWKPTWVLLAAAAVLFAFIVLVEHPLRQERLREVSRFVLPGLKPETVTNVKIHPVGNPSLRERAGQRDQLADHRACFLPGPE